MDLKTPLKDVGRTYKMNGGKLEKLGLRSIEDLLLYIPARYEDFTLISPIERIQPGEVVTIQGKVIEAKNQYTRNRFVLQKIVVSDGTGIIECMWFNQPYIIKNIHVDDFISIAGHVTRELRTLRIQPKEYEVIDPITKSTVHTGRLVPIYHETKGLSSKWIRNRVMDLIKKKEVFRDHLPLSLRSKYNLTELDEAITQIHFPASLAHVQNAKTRLSFDELLLTHLSALKRKSLWQQKKSSISINTKKYLPEIEKLISRLPFTLTASQQKALSDIFKDLEKREPMNRLLQGDVGSGKTIVAAITMYLMHLNQLDSLLMAPTEILAQQHFKTISKLLEPLGVLVVLVTSSQKEDLKKLANTNKKGTILIGTHALLQEKIILSKVGLVVIDEQQRFGVKQRALLRSKGTDPHVLTMTATPIPRTMLLTLYGDLNASYLTELPAGRKKIKTWLVPKEKRMSAYEWIKKKINETDENGNKNQVFIVCPFIEESENMKTVKAAVKEFAFLKDEVFRQFSVGLLHGKLKAKEKDQILKDFHDQKIDILVATPVVEVGIDIPNASIIVIEASERFGLSQLHQLRGRVGRRNQQAYCLLFTDSTNEMTLLKLKNMEKMELGAQLAELDLRLRGPGEMYGTRQHGSTLLKIASFADFDLIEKTKYEAEILFEQLEQYPQLTEKIITLTTEAIAPD